MKPQTNTTDASREQRSTEPVATQGGISSEQSRQLVPGSRRQDISGPGLLDLIWKINCRRENWSATLRSNPSIVVTAGTGDELAQVTRDLTMAILEGRGTEVLRTAAAAA